MGTWTESQIIDAIQATFPTRDDLVSRGIGDDCAVMRPRYELVTTDASVDGVHFDLSWMTPADAAYRCLTSNISDIAAMGGEPGAFTLALGLPKAMAFAEITAAITALRDCIRDHGLPECWLIGGDVVRAPQLMFSVTMFGRCPHAPILRNGARPEDTIVILGNPGMSCIGLALCQKGLAHSDDPRLAPFLNAFKRPRALTALAKAIAQSGLASAMMDLSDGIRTDLPRLLAQSRCGAKIDIDALSASQDMRDAAYTCAIDPVSAMLCGGEDFGLLLTCNPSHLAAIKDLAERLGSPCHVLGTCTAGAIEWTESDRPSNRKDISFTHFGDNKE
ncbi:MAG: thiamine-phosphate kinase [Proteobacteria bacterium]|nr:thiamine-phosphate kinase [Pseudomonadota bacterium]